MKACELHRLAVVPIVMPPLRFAGQLKVRPPVVSWQTTKYRYSPALAFERVELVMLPARVIFWVLPSEASNVGVAEKATAFKADRTEPATSSFSAGVVVPSPRLPALSRRIFSARVPALSVENRRNDEAFATLFQGS